LLFHGNWIVLSPSLFWRLHFTPQATHAFAEKKIACVHGVSMSRNSFSYFSNELCQLVCPINQTPNYLNILCHNNHNSPALLNLTRCYPNFGGIVLWSYSEVIPPWTMWDAIAHRIAHSERMILLPCLFALNLYKNIWSFPLHITLVSGF